VLADGFFVFAEALTFTSFYGIGYLFRALAEFHEKCYVTHFAENYWSQ
jgi:hypothetical protein